MEEVLHGGNYTPSADTTLKDLGHIFQYDPVLNALMPLNLQVKKLLHY